MDDALKIKMKKLLALAEKGVGGEKDNAAKILSELMARHDISMAELTNSCQHLKWFKYRGSFYRRLLFQIICAVCGHTRDTWKSPSKRSHIGVEVTPAEYIEIELQYRVYSLSLKKELDCFFFGLCCEKQYL